MCAAYLLPSRSKFWKKKLILNILIKEEEEEVVAMWKGTCRHTREKTTLKWKYKSSISWKTLIFYFFFKI